MNMKSYLFSGLIAGVFGLSSASGVVVTDDFNRAATTAQTPASSPNEIGTQYTITNGSWMIGPSIGGTYLQANEASLMYLNTVEAKNTEGFSFTLTSTVLIPTANNDFSRSGGLVFGLQDANNYYALRVGINAQATLGGPVIGQAQLVKVVGGVATSLAVVSNLTLSSSTYYNIAISSSTTLANTFTYSISTTGGSLIYSNTITDSTFEDGYIGFYRNGGGTVRFDDFTLEVVPEPSVFSLAVFGLAVVMLFRNRKLEVVTL